MAKKTTEQFNKEAKKLHNNLYEYPDPYLGSLIKIRIECKIHGMFEQTPKGHMKGYGCPECGKIKNNKNNELIKLKNSLLFKDSANKVHMFEYEYPYPYISSKIKIGIECKIHGIFEQTPHKHINEKQGCPKCAVLKNKKHSFDFYTIKQEDFLSISKKAHDNFYSYEKSIYVNNKTKIIITCPLHGDFSQVAGKHMRGFGCLACSIILNTNKLRHDNVSIEKIYRSVHGERYIYNGDYVKYNECVRITCRVHGDFDKKPSSHISGGGCPKCAYESTTFYDSHNKWKLKADSSSHFDSYKFYIIRLHDENEEFYKIGITFRNLIERFRDIPYKYDIIYQEFDTLNCERIFNMEIKAKQIMIEHRYFPMIKFGGHSECLNISTDINKLIEYVNL